MKRKCLFFGITVLTITMLAGCKTVDLEKVSLPETKTEEVYKSLEEKETVVSEVLGCDEAKKRIKSCIKKYRDTFC